MKAQLSGEDSLATRHGRLSPGSPITTPYSVEESALCRSTFAALYRSILAAVHWMLPVACLLITCTLLFERLAKAEEA
jgi:hypothetical protein